MIFISNSTAFAQKTFLPESFKWKHFPYKIYGTLFWGGRAGLELVLAASPPAPHLMSSVQKQVRPHLLARPEHIRAPHEKV